MPNLCPNDPRKVYGAGVSHMASIRARKDRDGIVIGWQCQVIRKGFPQQTKTFQSKAEAAAWAAVVESEMTRGVWRDRSESERTTLGEALERYTTEILPSKKGADREAGFIRQWIVRPIAQKSLASIRSKDIADVIKVMVEDEGKGPNTIRLHLAVISHLFSVAATDWGMESLDNPIEHVRKPKLPKGRDRRLVDDEETRLLDACRAVNLELASIVQIAIETAMRQEEIMNMTWKMMHFSRHFVHLDKTKNGEERDVPLSTTAERVLTALPRRMDGKVWTYTQEGMRASYVKAKKHAGIEGLTFHDLRHEATSRFFEKGLNPMQVAAITGHKTLQMLKRYTHLRAEDLAKMLG